MSKPKCKNNDIPWCEFLCCLNCRSVAETARDWESNTLYCVLCGKDLNNWELYLEDE